MTFILNWERFNKNIALSVEEKEHVWIIRALFESHECNVA